MVNKRKRKVSYQRLLLLISVIAVMLSLVVLVLNKQDKSVSFDKKAVWISYLNMETLKDQNEQAFKQSFSFMCDKAIENKLNTLIVQVRPFQDAIYPSKLFPTSFYISSSQELNYDPLAIMVETAHEKGLFIEAWINPYRISYNQQQWNQFKTYSSIKDYANSKYILKDHYNAMLNPASEEVREYIVAGVDEIIQNYNVDGIHFDDYFYRESMFQDTTQKERQQYVNALIREVYATIKAKDAKISFGISPQGNLDNARNIGADIDTWLREDGYVDYVMPQIYWTNEWGMNQDVAMFDERVQAYQAIHQNENTKLYAGLALYLCGQDVNDDFGWQKQNDNLKQQVETVKENGWQGYSLFDYDSLLEDSTRAERSNLFEIIQ